MRERRGLESSWSITGTEVISIIIGPDVPLLISPTLGNGAGDVIQKACRKGRDARRSSGRRRLESRGKAVASERYEKKRYWGEERG